MNNSILILGESGSGKSSSIRTLPSSETFVLNIIGKSLPFRGSAKNYTKLSADGLTGNYYSSDDVNTVIRVIKTVNLKRPDIKYLIIDDAGYLMMNNFMRRCLEKGYDKFSSLGKEFSDFISLVNDLRDDLFCFVMMHVESDKNGRTKPKTVGAMVDQYICIEGKFPFVLHTTVNDGNYRFITNNDNYHMCKTPMGCFPDQYIENDLMLVVEKINEYINEDISI